jgi:hypothetical protein
MNISIYDHTDTCNTVFKVRELPVMTNISRGDFDLDRLVREYHKALVAFIGIRIYCFGGRQSDAEDIAQEVWLDVSQKNRPSQSEGAYDPDKGAVYTYLVGFARNKIKQWRANNPVPVEQVFGQFNGPQQLQMVSSAYSKLFSILFICGGYPHEQLSFAFSKHIYGQPSSRAIEGSSEKLDSDHGDTLLNKLLDEYWQGYSSVSQLEEDELEQLLSYLKPVRTRMELKVKELMSLAPAALKCYENLQDKKVAKTRLRDYYANLRRPFGDVISDWCYGVEDKIRRKLGIPKGTPSDDTLERATGDGTADKECQRCKLRTVGPCSDRKKN